MKNILLIILTSFLLGSCSEIITKGNQYPKLYDEKPVSVVIMPPINQTNFVEAKEYFYTTLYMPLCEKGYYVYSPYLTMEMFQSEGAYDSEMFIENDLTSFRNFLGADAAMFTIIKSWNRSTVSSSIKVNVEYIMRSTTTNETLYKREGLITLDTSLGNGGGGIAGLLLSVAISAINTALTEKVEAGRCCTAFVLNDLPCGRYSPQFSIDASEPAGKSIIKATVKGR